MCTVPHVCTYDTIQKVRRRPWQNGGISCLKKGKVRRKGPRCSLEITMAAPYTVISICGTLGSLHLHDPPQTTPHTSHSNCRLTAPSAATLLPPHHLLTTTSRKSTTTLTLYTLTSPPGPTRNFSPPEPHITALASTTPPTLLAAGAQSGRVYIWHTSSGRLLAQWHAHHHPITHLSFTDDSTTLITTSTDAIIHAFSLSEALDVTRAPTNPPSTLATLSAHTLPITALAVGYASASARIITASADRSARIWHLASTSCLATILLPAAPVQVALTTDESAVFIGLRDGTVVTLELAALSDMQSSRSHPTIPSPAIDVAVTCLSLSPCEQNLIVGYTDGLVRVFDARTRVLLSVYAKHSTTAPITAVMAVSRVRGVAAILINGPLERVWDPNLPTSFRPLLHLQGGVPLPHLLRDVMAETTHTVFEQQANNEPFKTAGNSHLDAERERLLQELSMLRRRNSELEHAGRRLVELVEQQAGQ